MNDYKVFILVERTVKCRSEEEAEQLARKLGFQYFENDAANKEFDLVGSMAEEIESDEAIELEHGERPRIIDMPDPGKFEVRGGGSGGTDE